MDAMFLGAAYVAQELGVKPLVGAGGHASIDCMPPCAGFGFELSTEYECNSVMACEEWLPVSWLHAPCLSSVDGCGNRHHSAPRGGILWRYGALQRG